MITKEYIIRITSDDEEQEVVKSKVESLFKTLEKEIEGGVEFYTKIIKLKEFGTYLYGIESLDYLRNK